MTNCFVATIDLTLSEKLKADLEEQGFSLSAPAYTVFQAKKKGVSCTLYTSGKLTVQGKDKDEFIEFYLEPNILGTFEYKYQAETADLTPRIGVDEAGKGDFFGPLCVASFYADSEGIKELQKLGIADSKKMKDDKILKLASSIKKFPHEIITLYPKKYNELYDKFKNLNSMLAWCHATVIETLHKNTHCKDVIIDQFASEHVVANQIKRKKLDINLTQRHKGEEDIIVAAASILARAAFVKGMDRLSEEYGIELPKGASNQVKMAGKTFVNRNGKDLLSSVSKRHFKTFHEVLLLC